MALKDLNRSFYIDKREDQMLLNGEFSYNYYDEEKPLDKVEYIYKANLPCSTYKALKESKILPDYYIGTNSALYKDVRNQVFYFKKNFSVPSYAKGKDVFLCFDGASYYTDIIINGKPIGRHIGGAAGPYVNITKKLYFSKENEIVIVAKSPVFNKKDFDPWNKNGKSDIIMAWGPTGESELNNGDFVNHGIWNDIRLEFVNKVHISRPYLQTLKIGKNSATLKLTAEITNELFDELEVNRGYYEGPCDYTFAFDGGVSGKKLNEKLELSISLKDKDGVLYSDTEIINPLDYPASGINPKYYDNQYIEKEFTVKNPKLWYPFLLGEPHLYSVEIKLTKSGKVLDTHKFNCGIKTIETAFTESERYTYDRQKYKFIINGRPLFIRGINWQPTDFMLDFSKDKYDWYLKLITHCNIGFIRVWGGQSIYETDYFYDQCDKLGIMVWQDSFITDMTTKNWDVRILDSLVSANVYRIRNHASLSVYCGGNEFNPYHVDNAAAAGKIRQTTTTLDPSKPYYDTTSFGGSAHIYKNMEPTRYRKMYGEMPFIGETGINSFPSYKALKKVVREHELKGKSNRLSEDYIKNRPELFNHIVENDFEHISKMTDRATQILNIDDGDIQSICYGTQLATYEYFQFMCEFAVENFPKTGGIMPWCFSRQFISVGCQTVDAAEYPLFQYYGLKKAYENITAVLSLKEISYLTGETVPLKFSVINHNCLKKALKLSVKIYDPELNAIFEDSKEVLSSNYKTKVSFKDFKIPRAFFGKFFFIDVTLKEDGVFSRKLYKPKCPTIFKDKAFAEEFRSGLEKNLAYDKSNTRQIDQFRAHPTTLEAGISKISDAVYEITVKNIGNVPAYPVIFEIKEDTPFVLDDNAFFLQEGETRKVKMYFKENALASVRVEAFNAPTIELSF